MKTIKHILALTILAFGLNAGAQEHTTQPEQKGSKNFKRAGKKPAVHKKSNVKAADYNAGSNGQQTEKTTITPATKTTGQTTTDKTEQKTNVGTDKQSDDKTKMKEIRRPVKKQESSTKTSIK